MKRRANVDQKMSRDHRERWIEPVSQPSKLTVRLRKKLPLTIFLITAAILLAAHGNRVVSTNDEGIILEPARRMAAGAKPYIDFFGYMSPGSYWLQAAVFRMFGISLWAGRLIVILDFSIQTALIFWLVARLASLRAAAAATLIFAGFQIADPNFLTSQHRWDSGTLALAGLCVALTAWEKRSALLWISSGALMAAAAWCTPTLALVGAAVALWLAMDSTRRRQLIPWTAGAAIVTLLASGWLALNGSFGAFVRQLVWLRTNYSAVNVMPYGAVIGGYRPLLDGASGPELAMRAVLIFCIALPAILPIAAVILSAIVLWRGKAPDEQRPVLHLLMLAVIAFVATVFPRADVMHLALIAAVPYALTAIALAHLMPARAGMTIAAVATGLASMFGANFFRPLRDTQLISSPVGNLRVSSDRAHATQTWLAAIHPGDSLFVYPYMPMLYFLAQARNPTQFSFLAPGVMRKAEESIALAELQNDPPEWLAYLKVPHGEVLRVFPNASELDGHFRES